MVMLGSPSCNKRIVQSSVGNVDEEFGEGRFSLIPALIMGS